MQPINQKKQGQISASFEFWIQLACWDHADFRHNAEHVPVHGAWKKVPKEAQGNQHTYYQEQRPSFKS